MTNLNYDMQKIEQNSVKFLWTCVFLLFGFVFMECDFCDSYIAKKQ